MIFTLNKAEQERTKRDKGRKSDQQQMHSRLMQLKNICRCEYGFCQGLTKKKFEMLILYSGPMKACDELMNLETLLYG